MNFYLWVIQFSALRYGNIMGYPLISLCNCGQILTLFLPCTIPVYPYYLICSKSKINLRGTPPSPLPLLNLLTAQGPNCFAELTKTYIVGSRGASQLGGTFEGTLQGIRLISYSLNICYSSMTYNL